MQRNCFQTVAATLACLGMMVPQAVLAGGPVQTTNDVALRAGGMLVGQVVNAQGIPQTNTAVSIQQGEQEVVRTTTDDNGVFAAQGLRGGQYLVATTGGQSAYRLWATNTAPPAAQEAALVVTGSDTVRGQYDPQCGDACGDTCGHSNRRGGRSPLNWVKAHPFITAGIIATAIALPIVLADDDDPVI